jgi:hypothetical protein
MAPFGIGLGAVSSPLEPTATIPSSRPPVQTTTRSDESLAQARRSIVFKHARGGARHHAICQF